ncbi:hypothetical protein EPH_0069160 [Eimeria praecox]|uniref:Uncharacterized protein n=1 Tax=Eimeria praecox TaxID=51316 RepID=U6H629_9EIME|nr:hypothetical protein EPH_0069160 [Eimeria praecox]
MRMPGEFEAATELLNLRPGQDATGHSLPTAKETVILQVLELQRMMDTRMEQMQRQMSRIELQLQELRWQLQRNQSQEQQQQPFPLQWQAQQGLYHHQQQQHLPWQHPLWEQQQRQFLPWGHMHWQQQQQQFSLQQTQQQQNLLQHEQHYSRLPQWTENQQATQPQEPSQAAQGQEQQQTRQQKGQHVPPRDERGQQTERGGRKRKHEEEPRIMQQEQQQLLQPADPLSAFSPEEWIDPGSPGQEIYNPRTSQQELQYSAVAEPGLSTSQDHSTHLTSRYQLVTVAASRTAAAGALRDEATVAAFEGAALAGAAARPSTFEDMSVKAISGLPPPPLAASPAAVAGASREEVAGAAAGGAGAPSAGAKADVTAADAAAGSAFAVSVSTEETKEVRVTQGSTSSGRPCSAGEEGFAARGYIRFGKRNTKYNRARNYPSKSKPV